MNKIFWQKFFRVFSAKERMTVLTLVLLAAISLVATVLGVYYSLTKPVPISGGDYSEGIIGQPMYVNPVLAAGNEADADMARLIYSGLFKYGSDGKIVPDLAESYDVSNDQLTYTVHLKQNVKWHDGEPFSSDDVLFTIQAIQDPAFKSPLRQNWQGVGMEQIDESTIKFVLPAPYAFFLNNLTVGIIPKHVWETVAPTNFSLAEYNLRPVGTGPFEFSDFQKDSGGMILSYKLTSNPDYFGDKPYLGYNDFPILSRRRFDDRGLQQQEDLGDKLSLAGKIERHQEQAQRQHHLGEPAALFCRFFQSAKKQSARGQRREKSACHGHEPQGYRGQNIRRTGTGNFFAYSSRNVRRDG